MDAHGTQERHQAPGGWRRGVLGVLVGAAFGALLRGLLPGEGDRS